MRNYLLLILFCWLPLAPAHAAELYSTTFARGAWDSSEWVLVKSPRWEHFGGWVQRDGCIENETPKGATPTELQGKRHAETYTSMVLKKVFKGDVKISSTMQYGHRMAPLIVIAPELDRDDRERPEYREHWEVVLFDKGVNVWHHVLRDGKPWWKKAAYARFPTKPDTKYKLEVRIKATRKGKTLSVFLDGQEKMGYIDEALPDELRVGITGCEGVNRFYDFRVAK